MRVAVKWKDCIALRQRETSLRHGLLITTVTAAAILGGILAGSSASALGRSVAADGSSRDKYYTSIEILPGDTLWGIADRYITSEYEDMRDYIQELKTLNGLKGDAIHAGQYLTVPYYVR